MKGFSIPKGRIFISSEPTKMSCGFPLLTEKIKVDFGANVIEGGMFLFWNKKKNYIKILYFDHNGYVIHAKKLPSGIFTIEREGGTATLAELSELMDHIVLNVVKKKRHLKKAA